MAGTGLGYAEVCGMSAGGTAAGGTAAGGTAAGAFELWSVAAALRAELLAMVVADERGDGAAAARRAAEAATIYACMGGALAAVAPDADRAITGELLY